MTRVPIPPKMLRWACERAGYDVAHLAARIPQLPAWVRRERQPTLKQLEKLAKATHTPLGYLFLPEPPDEHLPVPDYRTVAGAARGRPSPDLLDTLYTMRRRQEWLRESLVENDAEPLAFVGSARLADEPDAVGREMRRALGLDGGWAAGVRTWQDAVSELRRTIEDLGVMAVINGVVGNNTHRRLSVEEFRGFALTDPYAPLIFVNGADAKSAQMFTLAHELAHGLAWDGRALRLPGPTARRFGRGGLVQRGGSGVARAGEGAKGAVGGSRAGNESLRDACPRVQGQPNRRVPSSPRPEPR